MRLRAFMGELLSRDDPGEVPMTPPLSIPVCQVWLAIEELLRELRRLVSEKIKINNEKCK